MSRDPSPYRIEKPCPKSWDDMAGDAKRRFCAHCQLHVHNLSAMSAREREDLVGNNPGRLCISYQLREDGSMVTPSRWHWLRRPLTAMLALLAPALSAACTRVTRTTGAPVPAKINHPQSHPPRVLLGEMCPPPAATKKAPKAPDAE